MKRDRPERMFLCVSRCPIHRQYWSVSLDCLRVEEGDLRGTGHRLTGTKCCGQWQNVKRFPIDPEGLLEDVRREVEFYRRDNPIKPTADDEPDPDRYDGNSW